MNERLRNVDSILGPCSVHSYDQLKETAVALNHGQIPNLVSLRANTAKPRTDEGSWTGMHEKAVEIIKAVKEETGCRISMEVTTAKELDYMLLIADDLWLGSKQQPNNTQEISDALKGVPLGMFAIKNPPHPDIRSWIGAIETMQARLNPSVKKVALFRGFFELIHIKGAEEWRYNPRIEIVEDVVKATGVEAWIDFSHLIGDTNLITEYVMGHRLHPIFKGVMLEVDARPNEAKTDKQQVLTPGKAITLIKHLRQDNPNLQIGII